MILYPRLPLPWTFLNKLDGSDFMTQGMWMQPSLLITSLLFCSFTALFIPSLEHRPCVECHLSICYDTVYFPKMGHQHISHPIYSSSSVTLTVHQGEMDAWEDICNCLANGMRQKWCCMTPSATHKMRDGFVLRHIPLKPWVVMLEAELPWSCHAEETTRR